MTQNQQEEFVSFLKTLSKDYEMRRKIVKALKDP